MFRKAFSFLGDRRGASVSPDAPYLAGCQALPTSLVFIMGCHRSGTSMLYHLLAYSGQVDYLSVYDIIEYDKLLYNRHTGHEAQVKADIQSEMRTAPNRGLDELPVGADMPEEYRFILSPKPQRAGLNTRKRLDAQFFQPHLTPQTLDAFLNICRKKRYLAGADRTLVLKNPSDYYFNFLAVHEMLPQAKFIFIHRHPLPMLNSYLHSFRSILDQPSKYGALINPWYGSLFSGLQLRRKLLLRAFRSGVTCSLLATRLTESFQYYMSHVAHIPPEQYVSVRYEDLCADPKSCLESIGRRLQLDLVPSIPAGFVAPRRLPISEDVRRHYAGQISGMTPYLELCEYPPWPDLQAAAAPGYSLGAAGAS